MFSGIIQDNRTFSEKVRLFSGIIELFRKKFDYVFRDNRTFSEKVRLCFRDNRTFSEKVRLYSEIIKLFPEKFDNFSELSGNLDNFSGIVKEFPESFEKISRIMKFFPDCQIFSRKSCRFFLDYQKSLGIS